MFALVYPVMIVADVRGWGPGVRAVLALLALIVLFGVKLALTDFDEWRDNRAARRRRARRSARDARRWDRTARRHARAAERHRAGTR